MTLNLVGHGRVRRLIDRYLDLRSQGNETLLPFLRSHLILKGIRPDEWDDTTTDDPATIALLERLLEELDVRVPA